MEKRRTPTGPAPCIGVGVGVAGHPPSELLTPRIRQLIPTIPLFWQSNAGQASTGCRPSEMFTPRISSLISTEPSPLQSPTQPETVPVGTPVTVGVGVSAPPGHVPSVPVSLALLRGAGAATENAVASSPLSLRSEERRVGKGCRTRESQSR